MFDTLSAQRIQMRVGLTEAVESPVHERPITDQVAPPFFVIEFPSIVFDVNGLGIIEWPVTLAWTRQAPQAISESMELELQRALLALGKLPGLTLGAAYPTPTEDNNIDLLAYTITVAGVLPNC